jgi:hypothetical protein
MKPQTESIIKNAKRLIKKGKSVMLHRDRLPDFIIIGVQKGGTTSLFYYLSQHPSIALPKTKEIHYYDLNYEKGLKWYKAHFPFKKSMITGEASPYYIFHPLVPERIYKDNPKAKLIVMLRNPMTRAYSQYHMERKKGHDKIPSFEDAIHAESERIGEETVKLEQGLTQKSWNHQTYSYLSRGKYAKQLKEWFKYFSKDQFLFIKSEDFFENPVSVLDEVCAFLDVPRFKPYDLTPINTAHYDTLNSNTQKYLERYYKDDNTELCTMIGDRFKWYMHE